MSERKKSEYSIKQIAVVHKPTGRAAYFDALRSSTAISVAASTVATADVSEIDAQIEALKAKRKEALAGSREDFEATVLTSTDVRDLGSKIKYTDLVHEAGEDLKVYWYELAKTEATEPAAEASEEATTEAATEAEQPAAEAPAQVDEEF